MAANLVLNLSQSPNPRETREHGLVYQSPRQPPNTGANKQGSLIKRESSNNMNRRKVTIEKDIRSKAKTDSKDTLIQDIDPSSYRNSIFHNICTDMLEKGFHQSFTELFELVLRQRSDHVKAGPASILLEPLIEHNHAKLEYLRVQLTIAEDAQRANDLDTVYMSQRNLAQYFEHTDDAKRTKDKWLSDYFYDACLKTGSMVNGDNRRKEGEAHCHVGLALENRGDLAKAAFHMETFQQLASKQKWHTDSGDSFNDISCEHLRRIYTSIAEEVHSEDPTLSITYLKKAHEIAQEGGDAYQEGKASFRLGNALEATGDSDSAITYHKQYLERCKYHNDEDGVGKAYKALARSFESKGDIKNAAKFLEMFVSVAERAGLQESLADACSAIGTLFNTMGDYDKAVEYFGRCYEICSQLNNAAALYSARVQYGVAKGHQFMGDFSALVTNSSALALQDLVVWKDARVISDTEQAEEEKGGEDREGTNGVKEKEEGRNKREEEESGGNKEEEGPGEGVEKGEIEGERVEMEGEGKEEMEGKGEEKVEGEMEAKEEIEGEREEVERKGEEEGEVVVGIEEEKEELGDEAEKKGNENVKITVSVSSPPGSIGQDSSNESTSADSRT